MTEKDFDDLFNQMPDAHSEHLIREFVARAIDEERKACLLIAAARWQMSAGKDHSAYAIAEAIEARGAECLTPS